MDIERATRQLANTVVMKRIVLFFVVAQFVVCTTALGNLINMTGAEQQLGGRTAYTNSLGEETDPIQWVPEPPQGLSDANLTLSLANYGVSTSASLDSQFSEDQIVADGSAFASAVWGSQPTDAFDVHGGGVSTFTVDFSTSSSPAYFYVNGQLNVDMEVDETRHPDEVFAYVRLSSADGTQIWQIQEFGSGTPGNVSVRVAHGIWLDPSQSYYLEAFATGNTVAAADTPLFKTRTASFSFTATATAVSIDIVPDTISTKTKSITCDIWPPNGYDVTQIDQGSLFLNGQIQPLRISVREHQQMLVVKFPTFGLSLEPGSLELTVSGNLTDGTPFSDSDSVTIVQKGGKPN
jgi:hypothetical protein